MILLDSDGQSALLSWALREDRRLFSRINQEWTNSFFDTLFLFMREAEIWIPFYLFLLIFITLNFGKKGWWWAVYLIMTAVVSDLLSSHIVKSLVPRLRPCHDPVVASTIRILAAYCPNSSSFTSSHACNHFAVATFLWTTLRQVSPWWSLAFAWAFLIAYAQVYVGVHYPVDIICGGILGSLIGFLMSRLFRNRMGELTLSSYNYKHA